MLQQIDIEEMVEVYMQEKDENDIQLTEKYSYDFIFSQIENHLIELETMIMGSNYLTQNVKVPLEDFLFHMIQVNSSPQNQGLFQLFVNYGYEKDYMHIIVQLIDFYQDMESESGKSLRFKDITEYISKKNPFLKELKKYGQIETIGQNAIQKAVKKTEVRHVKEIDLNPPRIVGEQGFELVRINSNPVRIDSIERTKQIHRIQYSESLEKLLVLDQYSDVIRVYSSEGFFEKDIRPEHENFKTTIILDMYWSEQQQRLGLTTKESYCCFWDSQDDFHYMKCFSHAFCSLSLEQSLITYLPMIDQWATADSSQTIHFWDIELETITKNLQSKFFADGVHSIIEVEYIQAVLIASTRTVSIWNIHTYSVLFSFKADHNRINKILFYETYRLLLTSGFDKQIQLVKFNMDFSDEDRIGALQGHSGLVTAIQCIEKTHFVISGDDHFTIKLWDIRYLKCLQTFNLELNVAASQFIFVPSKNLICLVSSRLIMMQLERYDASANKIGVKQHGHLFIQQVHYDYNSLSLLCCTKEDIRVYSLEDGQVKIIISGILIDPDDEIITFKSKEI